MNNNPPDATSALENAASQYVFLKDKLSGQKSFPKTYNKPLDRLQTSASDWWCSGFYPGTLFYLYEETGNKELFDEGVRMLALLEKEQYNVNTHDIGFMMYCSYGNINRIAPSEKYKEILVNSAKSLITRFNPKVGCLKSHNRGADDFVVIIDNMMNLELLFWASQATGDSTYHQIAVTHANTTLKNHFRPDGTLYHGLNYNPSTGGISHYQAGQGYSETSAWARGQAWGIYGYTMSYRFTKNEQYLEKAISLSNIILNHPNMPDDLIPYWDFNAPDIPYSLRDASAAAIICSGLLELAQYVPEELSEKYLHYAEKILSTLSSPQYTAPKNTNGGFILTHSVGNLPAMTEVDVPLTYADYYYVEALKRYKAISGFSRSEIDLLTDRLINKQLEEECDWDLLNKSQETIHPDGSWTDIDYTVVTDGFQKHLDRLVNMALAYRQKGVLQADTSLLKTILSGMDYFLAKKPLSSNWWYNDIGTPQKYMVILILLKHAIDKEKRQHYASYLEDKTGNPAHKGKNRTWVSSITIYKGCIEDNLELVKTGFQSIASTVKKVDYHEVEGIKTDNSIHQHRPQLYSGGYGMSWMSDLAEYIHLAQGTSFALLFPPEKLKIISEVMLNGQQLLSYRGRFDFGTVGRNISRMNGTIDNPTKTLDLLSGIDPENTAAYEAWKKHIDGTPFAKPGNKHFWQSDIMTHHGNNYYLSAKVISIRTNGTESLNKENRKGYYLPLGATNIMTTGKEYDNIFPVWNWTRIPGTTAVSSPDAATLNWYHFGSNKYAGGVSNGQNGLIAFEHIYNGVQAKKAYFFINDVLLCMGADITAYKTQDIVTTVNQCHANGVIYFNENEQILHFSDKTKTANNVEWVYHDHVGYVFPMGGKMTIQRTEQTGSWNLINETGSKQEITQDVFSLWLDHGNEPQAADYCYMVMPEPSLNHFEARSRNHGFVIVKNESGIQAVRNEHSKIYAIVFYNPGSVALDEELEISADKEALVLIEKYEDGYKFSVSDPLYTASEINLTVNKNLAGEGVKRQQSHSILNIKLPQGEHTGSSIQKEFQLLK
jgi:chondroitin AC lyase